MIVAVAKGPVGDVLVVGLTNDDVEQMKKGLTKTKQGGSGWKFSSMVVFMGESDKKMMELLNIDKDTKRDDDIFPNIGIG